MDKKVIFNYIYKDDYSPEYFTGILSTVTLDNNMILNFYIERNALPKKEVFTLDSDGELDENSLISFPQNDDVNINLVRHVKTGVTVDKEGAKNIIELLEEYLKLIEETDE